MHIEALKQSPWVHLLMLVVVGGVVYANTLGNAFNVDDHALLLNNPAVHGLTWENIVLMFSSVPNGLEYLPIRDLTYAIDYTFWGLSPVGYHAANLLYYLLASCAFYLLLRRLLPLLGSSEPLVALLAAFLFVVHPVHVESLAGIAQRKDLVSGALFVASIYGYVSFRERGRWAYYAGSCGLYLLALLSKSTVIILPLLLLGLEIFWLDRPQRQPESGLPVDRNGGSDLPPAGGVLPCAPLKSMVLALPYLVMSIAYYFVQASILVRADVLSNSSFFDGLGVRFNTALRAVMFYLGKLLVPYPLSFVHPFAKSSSMVDPGGLIGLLVVIVVAGLLCWCYTRSRATALGTYWLLVCLLPVIGILPTNTPYIVTERYLFLSSMGFCLLVAHGGWMLAARWRRGRQLLTAYLGVAVVFAALAFVRNRDWQDSITLLEKNVAVFPVTMDPRYSALRNYLVTILGMEYYTAQRDAEAAATFARLKAMNPALAIYAELFAAIRLYEQQNIVPALQQLDAITIPDKTEIYEINYLYGNLYAAVGATDMSRASYRRALQNQRSLGFLTVNKAEVEGLLRRLPYTSP